jgi:hypothetical protein
MHAKGNVDEGDRDTLFVDRSTVASKSVSRGIRAARGVSTVIPFDIIDGRILGAI